MRFMDIFPSNVSGTAAYFYIRFGFLIGTFANSNDLLMTHYTMDQSLRQCPGADLVPRMPPALRCVLPKLRKVQCGDCPAVARIGIGNNTQARNQGAIRNRRFGRAEVPLRRAYSRIMLFRFIGHGAASLALAVTATLPLLAVACDEPAARPTAPHAEGDRSRITSKPGDVKETKPPATGWNTSGLSDAELSKRLILRCHARPQLCAKQPNEADPGPPRDPASDKGPPQ
jgi:hypothetical protein